MQTAELVSYLAGGALLGLTAGISPGPVLALVISETLKHSRREGIKVALSPLITDLPIILISLLLLSGIDKSDTTLGIIAITGGMFLIFLGLDCLKFRGMHPDLENPGSGSLVKGITTNLLNPHPYLFWITVGAPLVFRAWQSSALAAVIFFVSFYFLLVGSKVIVAILTEHSKSFLNNKGYIWIMRILGAALVVFAVLFITDGVKMILKP